MEKLAADSQTRRVSARLISKLAEKHGNGWCKCCTVGTVKEKKKMKQKTKVEKLTAKTMAGQHYDEIANGTMKETVEVEDTELLLQLASYRNVREEQGMLMGGAAVALSLWASKQLRQEVNGMLLNDLVSTCGVQVHLDSREVILLSGRLSQLVACEDLLKKKFTELMLHESKELAGKSPQQQDILVVKSEPEGDNPRCHGDECKSVIPTSEADAEIKVTAAAKRKKALPRTVAMANVARASVARASVARVSIAQDDAEDTVSSSHCDEEHDYAKIAGPLQQLLKAELCNTTSGVTTAELGNTTSDMAIAELCSTTSGTAIAEVCSTTSGKAIAELCSTTSGIAIAELCSSTSGIPRTLPLVAGRLEVPRGGAGRTVTNKEGNSGNLKVASAELFDTRKSKGKVRRKKFLYGPSASVRRLLRPVLRSVDNIHASIAAGGKKCPYCSYVTQKPLLRHHVLLYHVKCVSRCEICRKQLISPSKVRTHSRQHAPVYKLDNTASVTPNGTIHLPLPDVLRRVSRGTEQLELPEARKRQLISDSDVRKRPTQRATGHRKKTASFKPTGTTTVSLPDEFKRVFPCSECDYVSTKAGLFQHVRRHHGEARYVCDVCEKTFVRHCDFMGHRKNHFYKDGRMRPFRRLQHRADAANNDAGTSAGAGAGASAGAGAGASVGKTLASANVHTCDICGYKASKFGVRSHKIRHHSKKTFQCDICMRKFVIHWEYQRHYKTHFGEDGKLKQWVRIKGGIGLENGESVTGFDCKLCSRTYSRKANLARHVRVVHEAPPSERDGKYMCEYCTYEGRNKWDVENHVTRRHREHGFKCTECGKSYAYERQLQYHVEVVHLGTHAVMCSVCGRQFKTGRLLKAHMARHEKKFKLFCDKCNKGFMEKARLDDHLETHKERSRRVDSVCSVCDKAFLSAKYLKEHMNNHANLKPYRCDICQREFALKQTLYKHKRVHRTEGEKPHLCPKESCGKRFHDTAGLRSHVIRHTGCGEHVCPVCGRVFTRATSLKRHACSVAMARRMATSALSSLGSEVALATRLLEPNQAAGSGAGEAVCHMCRACGHSFTDAASLKGHTCQIIMLRRPTPGSEVTRSMEPNQEASVAASYQQVMAPQEFFTEEGTVLISSYVTESDLRPVAPGGLEGEARHCDVIIGSGVVLDDSEAHSGGGGGDSGDSGEATGTTIAEVKTEIKQEVVETGDGEDVYTYEESKMAAAGEELYQCSVCHIVLSTWDEIQQHMMRHVDATEHGEDVTIVTEGDTLEAMTSDDVVVAPNQDEQTVLFISQ